MKHLYLCVTALIAGIMVACSSMEVDEQEQYVENYPEDFVDTVYMELHPVLRSMQIKMFVKSHNDSLMEKMSSESFQKMMTKDTAAFMADTSTLHALFVDPYVLNSTEDDWNELWQPTTSLDIVCEKTTSFREMNLIVGKDTTKIFVDSVTYKSKTMMKAVYGKTDTVGAPSKEYVLCDTIKYYNKGAVMDTIETCDTTEVVTQGSLTAMQKKLLKEFNFYDTTDDLKFLKKVPMELKSIAYHFLAYGRIHGWAYRRCTKDEKKNPVAPVLEVDQVVDELYCDDDGVVRVIK